MQICKHQSHRSSCFPSCSQVAMCLRAEFGTRQAFGSYSTIVRDEPCKAVSTILFEIAVHRVALWSGNLFSVRGLDPSFVLTPLRYTSRSYTDQLHMQIRELDQQFYSTTDVSRSPGPHVVGFSKRLRPWHQRLKSRYLCRGNSLVRHRVECILLAAASRGKITRGRKTTDQAVLVSAPGN